MAEKKKSRKNFVLVEGYLKEDLLETYTNNKGTTFIRGSITIAINEMDSHRVEVFVGPTWPDGSENEAYAAFASLLPSKVVSIANYLKTTPTANFATAKSMATKVWVTGYLEEDVYRKELNGKFVDTSYIKIRANKAGIANSETFETKARFDCDMFIESIRPEMKDEKETGRSIIVGLLPFNNGIMNRIDFITSNEDYVDKAKTKTVADYISENYDQGQTANFKGNMKSLVIKEKKEAQGWGVAQDQYVTTFVRERVILGGGNAPMDEDDEGAITRKDVKEGLAIREEKAQDDLERRAKAKTTKPAAKTNTGSTDPFGGNAGGWGSTIDDGLGAEDPETKSAATDTVAPDNNLNFNFNDF